MCLSCVQDPTTSTFSFRALASRRPAPHAPSAAAAHSVLRHKADTSADVGHQQPLLDDSSMQNPATEQQAPPGSHEAATQKLLHLPVEAASAAEPYVAQHALHRVTSAQPPARRFNTIGQLLRGSACLTVQPSEALSQQAPADGAGNPSERWDFIRAMSDGVQTVKEPGIRPDGGDSHMNADMQAGSRPAATRTTAAKQRSSHGEAGRNPAATRARTVRGRPAQKDAGGQPYKARKKRADGKPVRGRRSKPGGIQMVSDAEAERLPVIPMSEDELDGSNRHPGRQANKPKPAGSPLCSSPLQTDQPVADSLDGALQNGHASGLRTGRRCSRRIAAGTCPQYASAADDSSPDTSEASQQDGDAPPRKRRRRGARVLTGQAPAGASSGDETSASGCSQGSSEDVSEPEAEVARSALTSELLIRVIKAHLISLLS